MIDKKIYNIFKNASKTYFYSSIFFTKEVKKDVFDFYAFVRLADDFVDQVPQDTKGYFNFKNFFYLSLYQNEQQKYKKTINIDLYKNVSKKDLSQTQILVIQQFINVINKRDIEISWIDSFFESMQMDIINDKGFSKQYNTMEDTLKYIYGSAEIIGLVMCKILDLPKKSYTNAMHLGRAMQYANFIRDVNEDISLNRCYFAKTELLKYNLTNLNYNDSPTFKNDFSNFLNAQIEYFNNWQDIAEQGYKYIPKRYLVPIKTAADMYKWATKKISKNPVIVYDKKVKPSVFIILKTIIKNYFLVYFLNKK